MITIEKYSQNRSLANLALDWKLMISRIQSDINFVSFDWILSCVLKPLCVGNWDLVYRIVCNILQYKL